MSNGADPQGSGLPSGANPSYRVVRELGKRAQRAWAAMREKNELVVVQRFTKAARPASAPFGETAYDKAGATYVAPDAMAIILRDARCLSKNWHPNVSRVRHVDLLGDDLTIATELVEGVTLADLITAARAKRTNEKDPILAFPLLARVIVDVLGGLHGLHGLRDGMNAPLNVFHGEIAPANIIVGKDGVARVSHVFRPRPVKIEAKSEGLGFASPETLGGELNQDARADIYSVGAMLWEGLTGRRLFEDGDPKGILQRQREEDLEPPSVASSSAFARLSEVATRALAFDPANRFRTASEMATEIRRIAGTRLAPGSAVAQTVMELAGDRIRARRAELDQSSSGSRRAFGAASIPPPTVNAKALADTTPKEPPKRDTQIIDDDGEQTQVDEPAPMTVNPNASAARAAAPAPLPSPKPATAVAPVPSSPKPAPVVASPAPAPAPAPIPVTAPGIGPSTTPGVGPAASRSPAPAAVKAPVPRAKEPPKPIEAPKPKEALTSAIRPNAGSSDDLLGPRGSDPNIMEIPLTATALARTAAGGGSKEKEKEKEKEKKAEGDALALAASREVALAEKSLVETTPLIVKPPPSPFALTPSAAPPSTAPKEQAPVLLIPKASAVPGIPASPFPLTPSARPPAYAPKTEADSIPIGAPSERIDLESVDVLEAAGAATDSGRELVPPSDSSRNLVDADGAKRESGGEPVAVALGGEDDAEEVARQRRKKMTPIFAAVAGVLVLILVVAGIKSMSGSKDDEKGDKTGSTSSTSSASSALGATTATSAPTPIVTETATPPKADPPPAPTPEPTPEPVSAKADPPPPAPAPAPAPAPKPTTHAVAASPPVVAPAPRPNPQPAAPAKKPKKSSYEPSGI